MTVTTPATGSARARDLPYELAREPDGRSWTVRENLADILARELLGPATGPEEVLDGPPDAAYLVGRIAPQRLTGSAEPVQAGEDGAAVDVGDAVDAVASRGVPVTAVDDSTAAAEDDSVEDDPQRRGLMVPASMGLRFQVPAELESLTVTSSWGVYHALPDDGAGADGRNRRYRRTPVQIVTPVTVAELTPGTTMTYQLQDDVVLRLDRYDDTERDRLLIEVALCNDRETPRRIPVDAWLYQTRVTVEADGNEVFLPVTDVLTGTWYERDDELRRLRLQYRDRLEYAVGRTCSVDWTVADGARRASRVETTWLPTAETPQTTAEEIDGALLDMTRLASASAEELATGLRPIVTGYADWLAGEQAATAGLPDHLRPDAEELVAEAWQVHDQLAAGLDHLLADPEALRCFQFANRVMADQRIQTQVAERRAAHPELGLDQARAKVLEGGGAGAHSWRSFQLAFILMQLPLLTSPEHERRSGDLARAQLLFFPTGGGKTEAYLGLAAYTFAVRRRRQVVTSTDGPLDGRSGVAVLMRYTLRLLTAQQFQRATALVCAAELARRADQATWGTEPFRIGLWVGTDVSPKSFDEAATQLTKVNAGGGYRLTVLQIQRCPWCGTRIGSGQVAAVKGSRRVQVHCGNEFAECPFAKGGEVDEGLPVLTVDEEIYRLAPAFVIATVDKFARLAREGEAAALFGYVARRCDRHGYVHEDYRHCELQDGSKHKAGPGLPAATIRPSGRLRPPDLIIQDELHLIAGALGTTVGLFEVAVDVLCSWRGADEHPVRPLLVASTATVRNAPDQVRALYGRDVTVFPPQVLDAGDTFFSAEQPVTEQTPGRRYVGVSTTGVRLTTAEIRVSEILLAAGQLLLDRCGAAADPYLTLVGYFNATRELAGMARYLTDDVSTALARRRPWSRLPRRTGTDFGELRTAELTARVSSADITATLDQMAATFDPDVDSTEAKRSSAEAAKGAQGAQGAAAGHRARAREVSPYDVVLATSMLQVGVDVTRLGLMLMVGQPKNTAEYIQASSRVGRDTGAPTRPGRPGLVVALGNWARPRDLAHFEQFRHYHETFYAQVEALSVTPFSPTALDRGLDGVLVSAARVRQADRVMGLSAELSAGRIKDEYADVLGLIDMLVARVQRASDEGSAQRARLQLLNRADNWQKRRDALAAKSLQLAYEKTKDSASYGPLMISTENARAHSGQKDRPPFEVPNSMREVQPEINVLVSPVKERLFVPDPPGAPRWELPLEENA